MIVHLDKMYIKWIQTLGETATYTNYQIFERPGDK